MEAGLLCAELPHVHQRPAGGPLGVTRWPPCPPLCRLLAAARKLTLQHVKMFVGFDGVGGGSNGAGLVEIHQLYVMIITDLILRFIQEPIKPFILHRSIDVPQFI